MYNSVVELHLIFKFTALFYIVSFERAHCVPTLRWNFLDDIRMIPMSPLMKMNLKEIGLLHCHCEFYSDNINVWTILRLLWKSVFIFKLASS